MNFKRLASILFVAVLAQGAFVIEANAKESSSKNSPAVEVIFETTMGSFTLELNPEKAQKTVANFLVYVDEGFYDNTLFHRVIPGFAVQSGGFEKGMKHKQTHSPVKNESGNGLNNIRGTISMARKTHPDTATSQFFINVVHNTSLDYKAAYQPGYTVFGKVTDGMDVIDRIVKVPTNPQGQFKDVPKEDILVLSAKRKDGKAAQASTKNLNQFTAGEHYIVLDKPVATRDSRKIEVVELFSYGCPHCYEFESLIKEWSKQQAGDIDVWFFPAIWNKPMKLYARAFYTAHELNVAEKIHLPLFTAIVVEHKTLSNENNLAEFFTSYGVDKKTFIKAFNSTAVETQVKHAEERVLLYKPVGVPEIIVNGKYRIDRMRAGGIPEMLAVAEYLVKKERAMLKK